MHENFESNIKSENQRYVIKLPVKENYPLLEDNYNDSLKQCYIFTSARSSQGKLFNNKMIYIV